MSRMFQYFPPAKLNLGLKITGKRSDGYHEIQSVFVKLHEASDELIIIPREKGGFTLDCSGFPLEGKNILLKTWELFSEKYGPPPPLELHLIKRIPPGAGLGGGSSDAAALLSYLADTVTETIPEADLIETAAKIGADVPFFLSSSPAYVSGIGERIQPLGRIFLDLETVIVWPGIKIPTRWAFQAYDAMLAEHATNSDAQNNLTKACVDARDFFSNTAIDYSRLGDNLKNDLEEPVFTKYPELAELKNTFSKLGALASAMSGSGSTIYGFFPDFESALGAALKLREKYPYVYCATI